MMFSQKLALLTSLHVIVSGVIAALVNSVQPQPYMDEIFHIPQIQRYCHGNYTYWDPMITTLPGLYMTSMMLVQLLVLIGVPMETACSVIALRAHNIIFVIINFILINCVMSRLQGDKNMTCTAMSSFVMSLFPVCYFFTFLYYTDQGSLCCVLLSYWLSLCGRHVTSGLVLLVAILFRQTNIIWAFFIAGTVVLREIERPWEVITGSKLLMLPLFLLSFIAGLYPYRRDRLIHNLLPYIMVAILFVMFVRYNGAIVVGDKSHHQAVIHLPQLFYFFSFTVFFAAPHLLLRGRGWWTDKLIIKFTVLAVVTMVALCAVHWFMHAHPYLLADNRHYTFYVWKNVLGRQGAVPYLLTPIFGVATFLCVSALSEHVTIPWVLLFVLCVTMATVPQKLIEFRYFIIPYTLMRLHIATGNKVQVGMELALYITINVITFFLFLHRPFQWSSSADWQRFMW